MARLLLLVGDYSNRQLLVGALSTEHDVLVVETNEATSQLREPWDLLIVDTKTLARYRTEIQKQRAYAHPVFLPVILLAPVTETENLSASLWEDVDESVIVPVVERLLRSRIDILLRTRRLSLFTHAELNQIFDSAGGGMCVVSLKGRVKRVNRAFAALLDRSPDQLVGLHYSHPFGKEPGRAVRDAVRRVLAGEVFEQQEIALPATTDEPRVALLFATPFRGLEDELLGVILDLRDVSEIKATEHRLRQREEELENALKELQRLQAQMLQQERLHALGQMASGVAHDFNNALSIILGYCGVLGELPADELGERARRYVDTIATAAKDASYVVKGLRGFYRSRDQSEQSLVSLAELVEQAIDLTRPRWQEQANERGTAIHIVRQFGRVPRLMANAHEIRESLTNVIFNAVDAMADTGGTLTFTIRRDGDYAVVQITDTGKGMSEDVRQRSLEPFFTTKGEAGSGLGLAMVYGIVTRHRGTVQIEAAVGEGTSVNLRLPLVAPGEVVEPVTDEVRSETRPLRILVVEDQAEVRESLVDILMSEGHSVRAAVGGVAAMGSFDPDQFDLVITDQAMPEMNGTELTRVIKAFSPTTPVLLLTGFDEDQVSSCPLPAGIDAVLRKPASRMALRQAVAKLLSRDWPSDSAGAPEHGRRFSS